MAHAHVGCISTRRAFNKTVVFLTEHVHTLLGAVLGNSTDSE